jgi:hypothetical protein
MAIYKPILDGAKTSEQIKVHKSFILTSGSYGITATQYISGSSANSGSFYDSLKANFYLSSSNLVVSGADWTSKFNNPYFNLGYYPDESYIHRNKFQSNGSVISISQKLFGEKIKRKSFTLVDNSAGNEIILKDDGYGNIYSTNATYSQSADSSISSSENYIGNIFYDVGIVTITDTGSHSGTWDLVSATTEKTSPSMTSQNNLPYGFYFKPDGTRYWMIGAEGDKEGIFEYNLSGSWDVGTATYTGNSIDYSDLPTNLDAFTDVHFKYDGTKMYTLNKDTDLIVEYPLSTAWNITTATDATSQSFSVKSTAVNPQGFYFRTDGLKIYMNGIQSNETYEMNMSTAWDISTITSTSQSFATSASLPLGTDEDLLHGITFHPDGTRMYTTGNREDKVYEHRLSTAWDITTATYHTSKSVVGEEGNIQGVQWKPDGSKMYIVGFGGDDITQYDMISASLYTDVTTGNYKLYFDSTQTIHVKEITFKLNPRDLNSTNNPTARSTISGSFKGSSAKMYSPLLLSALTGSGWNPYFTTIGFYNKSSDEYGHEFRPVMVAKFPQAIRSRTDVPIIFKIRYDY